MNIKETKYGDLSSKKIHNRNIELEFSGLTSLKGLPKEISGSLYIRSNLLTTLKFCSDRVLGNIDCSGNQLKTLKGSPKIIYKSFDCSENKLTSLKYSPEKVEEDFDCECNNIETLEYCPKKIGAFLKCKNNPKLKNIKEQIIKYQIEARRYWTDEGTIYFKDIKKEFEEFGKKLLKQQKKQEINKKSIDYGFSI